jgi:hypothetical protein
MHVAVLPVIFLVLTILLNQQNQLFIIRWAVLRLSVDMACGSLNIFGVVNPE